MLTARQIRILESFLHQQLQTAEAMSQLFSVSTKTIRNEIKTINENLESHDVVIDALPRKGFMLTPSLSSKEMKAVIDQLSSNAVDTPESRSHHIIVQLLMTSDYVKIENIAEAYFVDRTSISKDLKYIRSCLEEFNLVVAQKPHYGIRVDGREFDKRRALVEYGYFSGSMLRKRNQKEIETLEPRVLNVLETDGIIMSDLSLKSLVYHLITMKQRIIAGEKIELLDIQKELVKDDYEMLVAQDILDLFGFSRNAYPDECLYVAMHIVSKKINTTSEIESCINNELFPEIKREIDEMLQHVHEVFGVNLRHDAYLVKSLGLHYNQMIKRMTFGLLQRNDLAHDIMNRFTYSYLIAFEMLRDIGIKNNILFNENEASFIALHIEYALERLTTYTKQILLVNNHSSTNTELIRLQFQKKFGNGIEIVDAINAWNLKDYNLNKIDLIISTVHLEADGVDVLVVPAVLRNKDFSEIAKVIKPSQKDDDLNVTEFSKTRLRTTLDENIHKYGPMEGGYWLEGVVLDNDILVKPKITTNTSEIIHGVLEEPVVYKSHLIKTVVEVSLAQKRSRRTLRVLHKLIETAL